MISTLFTLLGGGLGILRILAIAGPLMYVFWTINDYRSQAVTISEQRTTITKLKKETAAWEARYTRINDKRGEYKLVLDKYEEAAKLAGCHSRVMTELKRLIDTKWKDDAFKGG